MLIKLSKIVSLIKFRINIFFVFLEKLKKYVTTKIINIRKKIKRPRGSEKNIHF